MKEFLKTNTITHNLMSFTGFKSILIFKLLLDGPKSYEELKWFIENHEYLNETISKDTLRIYLNSLRKVGCNISKNNIDGVIKYSIDNHPLQISFSDKQIKSILKVFKAISKSIDVDDLISLQQFFNKISEHVSNEDLKIKLKNISPLNNINPELIKELMVYARQNAEITVSYASPNSGTKNITILVDKLLINNGKLYVCGINSEHANYASFLVTRILSVVNVNINKKSLEIPEFVVGYEYTKEDNVNFELLPNEKIIKVEGNKYYIELTSKDKFGTIQRLMYHAGNCKVLYPESIKNEVISNFKKMKEGYLGK